MNIFESAKLNHHIWYKVEADFGGLNADDDANELRAMISEFVSKEWPTLVGPYSHLSFNTETINWKPTGSLFEWSTEALSSDLMSNPTITVLFFEKDQPVD
jgi:hypothetical protein